MKKTKDSQETKILRKPVVLIETTADTGLTQAQVKDDQRNYYQQCIYVFQPDFSCDCSSAASGRCIS